jgi:hypothetical protein
MCWVIKNRVRVRERIKKERKKGKRKNKIKRNTRSIYKRAYTCVYARSQSESNPVKSVDTRTGVFFPHRVFRRARGACRIS